MNNEINEPIAYYDFCLPDAKSGKYKMQVILGDTGIQQLRENHGNDINEQVFHVSGQRFNLPSSIYNSCYPPEQGVGDFRQCLPHLVFNKSTLPWEWNIQKDKLTSGLPIPWFALLVFHENEIPIIEPTKLENLKNITPVIGEDFKTECLTINIDIQLYNRIMPKEDELPFLFHAKAKGSEVYSVGMSNRLPKPGKNEVHLISLMGMDRLSDLGKIRLVSLKKWSFQSVDEDQGNFTALVTKFQNGAIRNKADFGKKSLSQNIQSLLTQRASQAFSLLSHIQIDGSVTFGWYRGPIVPFQKNRSEKYFIFRSSSFEKNDKKSDLSYSAAWQLGQLLALKDQVFAQKLQAWKQRILSKSNRKSSDYQLDNIINQLDQSPLVNLKKEDQRIENQAIDKKTDNDPTRDTLLKWLSELSLLHHIPYYYLVASNQLISDKGSGEIAFFYIDTEWIDYILSGALSLVFIGSNQIPTTLLVEVKRLLADIPFSVCSGFILRSNVLQNWPNMEIEVLNDKNTVQLIRKENLSDTILLALYQGSFNQISLSEPFQALHFGFENDGTRKINNNTITQKFKNESDKVLDIKQMNAQIAYSLGISATEIKPATFAFNMVNSADRVTFNK